MASSRLTHLEQKPCGHRALCCVQVVTAAAEAGEVVMFFCKLGKDRTGLIALFILSCCGSTDDEIISDYHRSGTFPPFRNPTSEIFRADWHHKLSSLAPCKAQMLRYSQRSLACQPLLPADGQGVLPGLHARSERNRENPGHAVILGCPVLDLSSDQS